MRKGFGICCIILGVCCLISSLGLIAYNRWEEEKAQDASKNILQDVQENMPEITREESTSEESKQDESEEISVDIPKEMLATQVDGYDCIGVLSIPVLELELPVLTDWSYAKLKIAPCHYFGSYYEKDFVIAAHNYQSHFGRLSELQPKDLILFTDISGTVYCYEVVLLETLPANATEEMITSGFDLSLYTCTPGGASRVTVRCSSIANE
ncbi:MAG: sortase [Lachnospiraceae bacterium]|nr:sortase [Lachnospiraceae bacterium]